MFPTPTTSGVPGQPPGQPAERRQDQRGGGEHQQAQGPRTGGRGGGPQSDVQIRPRIHHHRPLEGQAPALFGQAGVDRGGPAHGGVLAAIALLAASTAVLTAQLFQNKFQAPASRAPSEAVSARAVGALWAACVICPAALLVNPYGWKLIRWTVSGVLWLHQGTKLEEWSAPGWNWDHAAFFILIALAAVSFAGTRLRRAGWEIVVCAGLAVFALRFYQGGAILISCRTFAYAARR